MSRCHVCERPRDDDERDYLVALRNGLYFPACFRCWFMWPDAHKRWPAVGYGRALEADAVRNPLQRISLDEIIDLLGDAA